MSGIDRAELAATFRDLAYEYMECPPNSVGYAYPPLLLRLATALEHSPTPDQDASDNASDADHHRETWETDLRDDSDINFDRENER